MQARTRLFATSLATILVVALPAISAAQQTSLETIDSLISIGQTEQARAALGLWKKEHEPDARSTWLTARLATRAQDAEDSYLNVTLTYGNSPYAAASLLRLGQARHAAGDAKQATIYFQRLAADYPTSEHRATAHEWLARTPAPAPAPARQRYAVQVAAFRELAGARITARQLEKAGFANVRIVTVPSNALMRVRVGAFESLTDAAVHGAKIKAAGFSVAIVSDATSEQPLRN